MVQSNAITDLESSVVEKLGTVSATGESIGDVFDILLGL